MLTKKGKPIQKLRAAHLSRRGTTFCTGCLHAPHLPDRQDTKLRTAWKKARVKVSETMIKLRENYHARFTPRIFAPDVPEVIDRTQGCADRTELGRVRSTPHIGSVAAVDPRDGSLWSLEGRALVHRARVDGPSATVAEVDSDALPACLYIARDGVLFGFEDGRLQRFSGGATTTVLELSDSRSFVRLAGIDGDGNGSIVVGEYGVFPGARCAHIYRSRDGGRTFRHIQYLRAARHVHVVHRFDDGRFAVTTGDIADERRLYVGRAGGRFRCVQRGWSGYTSMAQTVGAVHCGTDLEANNGIVTFRRGLARPPEYRRLPSGHDCQVRQLLHVGQGRLVALCVADDTPELRADQRGVVLCSIDDGRTFDVVYRFAADWHDVPDSMLVLSRDPVTLLLLADSQSMVLELALDSQA